MIWFVLAALFALGGTAFLTLWGIAEIALYVERKQRKPL